MVYESVTHKCLLTFSPIVQSSHLLSKKHKNYNIQKLILPVVLYGCETWAQALRGEHRMRVFENMVLRRRFGPKRDEVTRGPRKLHNEELHNLYFTQSIIRIIKSRRMRWAGYVARVGERRNAYRILVEKLEETTRKIKTYVDRQY
jgi:hypothetical protein